VPADAPPGASRPPGSGRAATEPVPEKVVEAIVSAYYTRVVNYPDELRRRAQSAFTITGFLATGLVGFGALASLTAAPLLVELLGFTAIALWTAAALAFARAVASGEKLPSRDTARSSGEFAKEVISSVREERKILMDRRRWGQLTSLLAAVFTIAALAGSLWLAGSTEHNAVVYLGRTVPSALAADPCIGNRSQLHGDVDTTSLGKDLIRLDMNAKNCDKSVFLPRTAISAIILDPE
jgi:hypothetical protein